MAQCSNCGNQVQGAFCMRCGAPVAGGAPQPPQGQGGWQQQQPPSPQQPQHGQQPPQYGQQPPQYGQQPPQYGQQPPQHGQQPPQYGQQPPQYGQQPPQYGQQPPQYGQQQPAAAAGMEDNVASALCYLLSFITGIIFLVLEPYSKNKAVRFHAFQAIFFGVACIAVNIAMMIVSTILHGILNYTLWFIPTLLSLSVSLCMLCAWLFLMYKAYNREHFKLPILGDLAEKQA